LGYMGLLWMGTPSGVYRLDQDVVTRVPLSSSESWWKAGLSKLFPESWLVEGTVKTKPRYERLSDRTDPYGDSFTKEFFVIVTPERNVFDEAIRTDAYAPAKDFERSLSWGRQNIYISVRDKFGNTMPTETRAVMVMPGVVTTPLLIAIFWLILVTLTLGLAPYRKFFHDAVMNPWLRKYGSLGLIPLAITIFPFIQRPFCGVIYARFGRIGLFLNGARALSIQMTDSFSRSLECDLTATGGSYCTDNPG
jgi:hypothetical protein